MIQLDERLRAAEELAGRCTRVVDVGTNHGFLPVHMLRKGLCGKAILCDVSADALMRARETVAAEGLEEKTRLIVTDGLKGIEISKGDVVTICGMGGDTISEVLAAAPWIKDTRYTLILQPQSAGQALRKYLAEHGFAIEREALAKDGHFFYTVLRAKKGSMPPLSPGQQYASPQLLREGGPLLGPYLARIETALAGTVLGLQKADEPEKLRYYETALAEIREMRKQHENCS